MKEYTVCYSIERVDGGWILTVHKAWGRHRIVLTLWHDVVKFLERQLSSEDQQAAGVNPWQ